MGRLRLTNDNRFYVELDKLTWNALSLLILFYCGNNRSSFFPPEIMRESMKSGSIF